MKIQTNFWKRRLVQTLYLLTTLLVAALFFGSAASAGIAQKSTISNETTQASEATNIGDPSYSLPLAQTRADHDLVIESIDAPSSGNAGSIAPLVTVTNVGDTDEYNVPLNVIIGKREVSGTIENFEATNGGYVGSGTPSVVWEWGTPTQSTGPSGAHSGVKVWGTDLDANYPASCNNKLDTPLFVVPPYAELGFWHWYDTEASYDGCNIKISTDGGSTWTVLTPAGGYTGTANTANPLYPEPIWTGHVQKYWEEETVDLSAYSGQEVKIRFHFGSDTSVQYPGWFIDDVGITSSSWINEYDQTQYLDIVSGSTVQVIMPSWTPGDMNVQENVDIDYLAEALVTLGGDATPADNYLNAPFTLHFGYFHDVAITQIVSPTDGQAETKTPEVVLANNGQNDEAVDVNMLIEKAQYTLYLEEYFEGTFPPTGWTNQIIQNHGWVRNDQTVDARPNYAGGSGYCADADADDIGSSGPWPMDCALISPSMDLSTVSSAIFSYTAAFNSLSGDYADVDISIDGGATWTNLQHWTTDHSPSGPGEDVQFDISPYCGNANVQIRFHYFADSWDWYYEVDNVKVYMVDFIQEYDETIPVDLDAGETTNVVFPDWTPSDITLGFDLDYRVTATASLGGFNTIGSEGFESYIAGHYEFPAGWTVTQSNPASTWFVYGTGTTHTSKCDEVGSLNLAQNELLTSPSYNLNGMNTIKLQYSAYFYRAISNGDSYVEVVGSLDNGVSWPQLITTYTATGGVSYSENIDISAWAANQPSVTIGYRFVSDADSNLTDYFYFDNFWIGNDVSVATESFSSYSAGYYNIPAGWTVTQSNPGSTWFVYGTGSTHTSKCQETGSLNLAQNEFLTSPVFNLVGLTVVKLQYSAYFYRAASNGDSYVEVVGSIDGGVSWPTLIKTYTATGGVSYSEDIDISAWAANQPSVQIGYRFVSTADSNLTDYFYFDGFWIGNEVPVVSEFFNNYVAGYYALPTGWTTQITNPTGKWWMYQSGTTVYPKVNESGSNAQAQDEWIISKTIDCSALTNVSLQFTKYFYRATTGGDSTGQVRGSIDGGATWPIYIVNYTATSSTAENRYITSWAAGQANVKIAFRFTSTADATLTDYFYFDDFFVGAIWGLYGNNPPTGWAIANYGSQSPQVWDNNDWHRYSTTSYPAQGQFARVYYSPTETQNEWLISPSIDCSALTTVTLEFWHYFYRYSAISKGFVNGSTDGGVTFPYVIAYYNAASDGPAVRTFNISSWAAGQSSVKVRFQYMDNNGMYWYVDDFKIKSGATSIYTQNFEGVGYMENFATNYVPATWGPLGWQVTPTGDTHWSVVSSANAGGAAPEARFYYSPAVTGNISLVSGLIDTSAYTALTLSFKHYVDWSTNPFTLKVETSIDGSAWGAVWSISPTADIPASTVAIPLSSVEGIGSSTFQMRFTFSGYSYNINYWYIDNVKLGTLVTIFTTTFNENWVPPSWGPLGWQVSPSGDTHWSQSLTVNAGGTSPELKFSYSPVVTANLSFYSGPIDTSAYTALTLSLKHYVDWYANPFTLKVETSIDGSAWGAVWSISPTADIPASTVAIPLSSIEGIGSSTFQMRFTFSGYSNNINYWYIDDVKLGTLVTIYTTTFNENWVPPSWGPLGWQVSPSGDTHWSQSLTVNAGGTSPELKFSYSPSMTGNFSFVSGSIDTSAYTELTLSFKHSVNHYTTPYTLKVETSSDGITWGTVWSVSPTASIPASTVVIPLSTANGIGSAIFQIRFTFSGYTFNINYWYIDDVKLGTLITVYTTTFNENWVPTNWGPAGWQQVMVSGSDPDNEWDAVTTSSYPSGVLPPGGTHMAQYDSYYINNGNSARLYLSNPIDFSSIESSTIQAKMWMYHDPGYSTPPYDRVEVQLSTDGSTWNTIGSVDRYASVAHWEEHTFDFSAYAEETSVYIGFLGISEYGNSVYMDDLSLEYYGLISDGNPIDNEMVNWITLTYIHDTGVSQITEPTGPSGNWPPGTYAVAGIVNNYGSFTEYDILVNAKIWKVVGDDDILFYESNATIPVLSSGLSTDVIFPDVTFENTDEGEFKVEMKTILPGDDSPNNDKKTMTFVIQAPDSTPPETTAEVSGTIGQNNWFVSNVMVMLTATDPAGKSFKGIGGNKWPMGVNHTYYKVDDATDWTVYDTPIIVNTDGEHTVYFYSDDKAIPPNIEEVKNVSFKIDKTAPTIIEYTATAQNALKNKWLLELTAEDLVSGIVLVEFYADDALVGTATTEPYEFLVDGKIQTSQCIVYDAAGNSKMSDVVTSYEAGYQTQYYNNVQVLQQKQQ